MRCSVALWFRSLGWIALLAAVAPVAAEEDSLEQLVGKTFQNLPGEGRILLDRELAANLRIDLQVEQSDFDVALRWEGPDGVVLWEVDGWTGPVGPERLFAVTESRGRYKVYLLASEPPIGDGRTTVTAASIAPANSRDLARSRAEELFWSGVKLRRGEKSEAADPLLKRAQDAFGNLGETGRQADCFFQRGRAAEDLSRSKEGLSPRQIDGLRFRALKWFQQARFLYGEAEDPFQEAASWEGIGRIEGDRDRLDRAIKAFQRSIPLRKEAGDAYSLAVAYQRLGVLHKRNGELSKAAEAYLKAIAALDDAPVDESVLWVLANAWNSRARVLLRLRQLSSAATALEEAMAVWRAMRSPRKDDLTSGHTMGIVIYALLGDFETAEEHRAAAETLAGSSHQRAVISHNASVLAYRKGDFNLAYELAKESLAAFESPWDQALARQTLASIRQAQGDAEGALENFRESTRIFKSAGDYAQSLVPQIGEAEALLSLGREDQAIQVLEPILVEVEGQRRELEDTLIQSSYLAARQRPFELAAQIQMERGLRNPQSGLRERAFDLVERSRGRILGDLIVATALQTEAREEAEPETDIQRADEKERWALEQRLTEGLQASRVPDERQEDAAHMRVSLELLSIVRKDRLERSPLFQAAGLGEPVTLAEMVIEMPNDLVVLMYELGEKASYGWAVTRDGVCAASRLSPRAAIEEDARALADSLLAPAQAKEKGQREVHAQRLSQVLLAPLSACLEKGFRILLLVEGELERVPFGYLPLPSGEGRVLDHHAVTRVQSISAWIALQRRARARPATSEFLLVGDPAFSDGTERLLGTRREITEILPNLPSGQRHTVALGFDAVPEIFASEAAAQANVWHLATHIEIDSKEPELSRIRLAGKGNLADLYAWQLHRLKMKPDLVVLSGCEGLLGPQMAGEGFVGLTHTFLLAGATQVIGSLWKVDDGASAALMAKFYRHFVGDTPPEEALRLAQLEMAAAEGFLSEPYYWAGFVVTGTSPK